MLTGNCDGLLGDDVSQSMAFSVTSNLQLLLSAAGCWRGSTARMLC